MNKELLLYNIWIALTAVTGTSAIILGAYLLRHAELLWVLLAIFFLVFGIEAIDSAITLGINTNSACRITSTSFIIKRMMIRTGECGLLFAMNAYVFAFFKRRKKVDRRNTLS